MHMRSLNFSIPVISFASSCENLDEPVLEWSGLLECAIRMTYKTMKFLLYVIGFRLRIDCLIK